MDSLHFCIEHTIHTAGQTKSTCHATGQTVFTGLQSFTVKHFVAELTSLTRTISTLIVRHERPNVHCFQGSRHSEQRVSIAGRGIHCTQPVLYNDHRNLYCTAIKTIFRQLVAWS